MNYIDLNGTNIILKVMTYLGHLFACLHGQSCADGRRNNRHV